MGIVCAYGESRPFLKSTLIMETPKITVRSTLEGLLYHLIALSLEYGGIPQANLKHRRCLAILLYDISFS